MRLVVTEIVRLENPAHLNSFRKTLRESKNLWAVSTVEVENNKYYMIARRYVRSKPMTPLRGGHATRN